MERGFRGGLVASGVPARVGLVAGGVGASRRRALARVARFVYLISLLFRLKERHLHYHNEGLAPHGAARAQILM